MSCCDGWRDIPEHGKEAYGDCPHCGELVVCNTSDDSVFWAAEGCNYSPCTCEECGARPCDQSC